jgi:NAD(P)-dependent dehydrogenase (short-subunit alcohol dehydrogenase family)
MSRFTARNIADQSGRLAIITGANSGTGFEAARVLAAKGASVVVAARSVEKSAAAIRAIQAETPAADIRFLELDLSRQASVKAAAATLIAEGRPIDILINNAGVMAIPSRKVTEDGFEMQLATNYLGHFAFTGLLMPLLKAARARTVQLSSIAHRDGRIQIDDLQFQGRYHPWKAYGQSKLAMLMFGIELQRRSDQNGWGLTSVSAHPGWARTNLIASGPTAEGGGGAYWRVARLVEPFLSHSAADGALPILMAATSPKVTGGGYFGATGFNEMKGPAGPAEIKPWASDPAVAKALWEASESLTGVRFA